MLRSGMLKMAILGGLQLATTAFSEGVTRFAPLSTLQRSHRANGRASSSSCAASRPAQSWHFFHAVNTQAPWR